MTFSGFTDDTPLTTVENDGWWPAMNVDYFKKVYRIPVEYTAELVKDALQQGMIWANRQLAEWKAARVLEGYADLASVPGDKLGIDPVYVMHYRRAVSCQAKALLLPQFKTMLRRDGSANAAVESVETEDKFYQLAQDAIGDFLGTGRINVELL